MSEAASVSVSSKKGGERAAAEVLQHVTALGHVPDTVNPHYDAVVTDLIDAEECRVRLADRDALPRGTRVEIKSAMVVYASGQRGRFYFRPTQHAALCDHDGVYLFAVCEPTPVRAVLTMTIVSARRVDDQLPKWFNGGDGRRDYAQLAWTNFVDIAEVSQR